MPSHSTTRPAPAPRLTRTIHPLPTRRFLSPPPHLAPATREQRSPHDAATTTASSAEQPVFVPEAGWNRSIWNPHVFDNEAAGAAATNAVAGGTDDMGEMAMRRVSPQEEVLRQQAVAVVFARFQVGKGGACSRSTCRMLLFFFQGAFYRGSGGGGSGDGSLEKPISLPCPRLLVH